LFPLKKKFMRVLELMNWRYATKAMNGKKVDEERISRILESIRLTPSSIGLQPYELIVISNPELKKELKAAANNQSQIEDCSHLVVFAVWDQYTPERINAWFDLVNEVRGVKSEGWERMRNGIVSTWPNRPQEQNFNHACMQAYIALGVGLLAAADEGVDATPMEGFIPAEVDRILGLGGKGLRSVLLMPLGYRDEEKDYLAKAKKVRKSMGEFVELI
jgi:nitroreductase / dihydropteridine reductase